MKKKFLSIIMALTIVTALLPTLPAQAAMKTVTVSNAEELLAAVASDTKIILEPGKYEITSETYYDYDSWGYFQRPRHLYIADINNLEIYGNGQAEIILDVGNMEVIGTRNSSNIVFDGLTIGHDVPEYGCEGDGYVFWLDRSNNIQINNCDIYGCGIYGIRTNDCSNITVADSTIRDCMMGIALLFDDIAFNRCSFLRNAYDTYYAHTDSAFSTWSKDLITVTCNNCKFTDNLNTTFASDNINVVTNNCDFVNNEWNKEPPELKTDIEYTVYGTRMEFKITSSDPNDAYAAVDGRRTFNLYLAKYDNSGRLINASIQKFNGVNLTPPYLYASLDLPKTDNYKYMIWDENMRPLMDAVTDIYN